MPTIKSAKKRMRQNDKRRTRNKAYKSAAKTQIKNFLNLIRNNDLDKAKEELKNTASVLDKAAQRNIFHKNYVSRKKSALHAKLNALASIEK